MRLRGGGFLAACALSLLAASAAAGDRLAFTGGVTQIEGVAGGGLVPWALIGGLETDTQVGASVFATHVTTDDFALRSVGAGVDFADRVETSFARQRFDAGSVAPGLTLGQDVVGVKVRLLGDAIFEPDRPLPQLAAGAEWKRTLDFDQIPRAVGAARGADVDLYVAATKLLFAAVAGHNVILDFTLRRTRANQFGLLGFGRAAIGRAATGRAAIGEDAGTGYQWEPEASAGVWCTEHWLLGTEYRAKPSNLSAFREDRAADLFLAWGPVKNATVTAAWVDLGRIAGKSPQRGAYISLSIGI